MSPQKQYPAQHPPHNQPICIKRPGWNRWLLAEFTSIGFEFKFRPNPDEGSSTETSVKLLGDEISCVIRHNELAIRHPDDTKVDWSEDLSLSRY
jgi:uncharacterized protein YggL (DUF469 family)